MILTLLGPTASGKTRLAARLAFELGSEVISADSRQVYKGMDLGTGKDLEDYIVKGKEIKYHLIDIRNAGERYNLFEFQHDCHKALEDIYSRGIEHPIICGGTGMYAESILRGYNLPGVPANESLRKELSHFSMDELVTKLKSYGPLHNQTDIDNPRRTIRAIEIADYISKHPAEKTGFPPVNSVNFCLDLPREERRARISARLQKRLKAGMTQEVERLLASGVKAEDLIYYGLEYKYVTLYVIGEISYQEMAEQLEIAIHQFAKRQMTWFRGMERRGIKLHMIDAMLPLSEQVKEVLTVFKRKL
ncbi:tRNA delta(2)-isopentenylpyrophosphate transferase [Porphyromonas macacae]|nr:tRNA delta(2)-isopentenylpyrophosphate transferase [Porphyromonas macacae]